MTLRDFLRGCARPAILPLVILGFIGVSAFAQSITGGGGGGGSSSATPTGPAGGNLSGTYPNPTLGSGSASVLNSGTLAAARGGAGTITGVLRGNGAGVVTQGSCADLSNATSACSQTSISPTAWTPSDASGGGLTFSNVSANHVRMGNMVFAYATLTYPATADGNSATITGLPIATANAEYSRQCTISYSSESTLVYMRPLINSTTISLFNSAGVAITNATMSTDNIYFICIYPAT